MKAREKVGSEGTSNGDSQPQSGLQVEFPVKFSINTLVVVADGAQAKLYRNQSGEGNLQLKEAGSLTPQNLKDEGPSGVRPPESTPQETDEATFAKQLAKYLNDRALANDFSNLVLAVDPGTLGQLRPCLHQKVQQCLIKEVDKTLTNSSVADIERSLTT